MGHRNGKRLRLIPSHLPLIRDKLADFAQYRLRKLGSQTQYEAMMANAWSMTDQIRTAQLWWVSRDMTRLAEDTVQAGDFPEPDPPAQCGMIFFEGDVQHISFRFDNDGSFQWLCGLLHAVWALSAEPHICEAKPAKPDMAHPLPQRFDPEIRKVKMLVLRENLHRPGGSADDDERVRREYSHRFIVRGFWRDQAYGPNHSLRRRQWIPPFVKGPADKPLVCKETVRIWRR